MAALESAVAIESCDADHPFDDEILGLMTSSTEVVITKEIPITAGLIEKFPSSVKLLV